MLAPHLEPDLGRGGSNCALFSSWCCTSVMCDAGQKLHHTDRFRTAVMQFKWTCVSQSEISAGPCCGMNVYIGPRVIRVTVKHVLCDTALDPSVVGSESCYFSNKQYYLRVLGQPVVLMGSIYWYFPWTFLFTFRFFAPYTLSSPCSPHRV